MKKIALTIEEKSEWISVYDEYKELLIKNKILNKDDLKEYDVHFEKLSAELKQKERE